MLIYETYPIRAAYDPYDNYNALTHSMRDLTRYANHIARALAEPSQTEHTKAAFTNKKADQNQQASTAVVPRALQLQLRPRIDWRETADGFVLTAATPGLRKDELKVEVVDASGESFIEIAGQTVTAADSNSKEGADAPDNQKEASKPLELRATYGSFSERVRLPQGVNREAMRATYEDGLLVVSIPRVKKDNVKRQRIAVN